MNYETTGRCPSVCRCHQTPKSVAFVTFENNYVHVMQNPDGGRFVKVIHPTNGEVLRISLGMALAISHAVEKVL